MALVEPAVDEAEAVEIGDGLGDHGEHAEPDLDAQSVGGQRAGTGQHGRQLAGARRVGRVASVGGTGVDLDDAGMAGQLEQPGLAGQADGVGRVCARFTTSVRPSPSTSVERVIMPYPPWT